ncbi:protein of unknown function [Modestobacter sp. DSM 44400]|uniref:DUF4334 domain-containing protein n=1 Tax=Modestobacter sp. DSM 44400 TaxID=1550230 RepID=UPI0008963B18|nr:DUF4334 domain-containing protein [Modestobacter sp. DSM 44400]SDX84726.1 protein of unknown function [Modestobacter sp. DSM 44400]
MTPADLEERLRELQDGARPAVVLAWFDALPPVDLPGMFGRWRSAELPTGHPFDGLLSAHRWYGKEAIDAETVHPLLFPDRAGVPHPLDPTLAPLWLLRAVPGLLRSPVARHGFAAVRPLLRTDRPQARLSRLEHRGVLTAALVYDRLPVVDAFRRVSADTLLGLMDLRGMPAPFPFVLRRDPPA